MSTQYYFAYGANTHIRNMAQRCPTARWAGTATLPNHALRFRVHADIEESTGSSVLGVLWIVDDEAVTALDHYEGFPHYYTKVEAEVWQDGEPIKALVYKMEDQSFQDKPAKDYLRTILEGYEASNVPANQVHAAIEHIKTDPQWDPIFERIKKTSSREFRESIMRNEYGNLDD